MSRTTTAGFDAQIAADSLRPALFVKASFDSVDINLWSGLGDKVFAGDTYTGAGNLLSIASIKETQKMQANGVIFTLSGIPASVLSIALTEEYQWRPITLWLGVMDANMAIIADPYRIFAGRMDVMEIADNGETSSIAIYAENNLIALKKTNERRYTHEDQIAAFPGDMGLEFMPTNADVEITWGAGPQTK